MRDLLPDDDFDIEHLVALIGAPPEAPMAVVRQKLERDGATASQGFLPRLLHFFVPGAGH
jgi:hypothetical protein